MTTPHADPSMIGALLSWAGRHLWAPVSGAFVAMGSALWGGMRKAIGERATIEYVDGHVHGLDQRVTRNEADLERRRLDVEKLHIKIDRTEDALEAKLDRLHEKVDKGLGDIFSELRRINR